MNSITSRSSILPLLFLVLSIGSAGHGQDLDNVSIIGRVVDQNQAVIPGAQITAVLIQLGVSRTETTDAQGRFHLVQLAPGGYKLKVVAPGFAVQETKLDLVSSQNAQLVLVLYPEEIVAPVVVSAAEPSGVDITRTVVGGTIRTDELETLPVPTRSALDFIFSLPGVTEESLSTRELAEDRGITSASTPEEAGSFALAGAPAYSNNITVDGLDNNDDRGARERFQPSIEAIEEVQVITNQFSAEYGRASGGRVNLRTRAGTRGFRGRAYYFFRDEALNANTFRNNSLGQKRLPLQQHNPGFTVSGPVTLTHFRAGKTFFFTSYEFDTLLDHALIDTLLPIEQNPRFGLPAPTNSETRRLEDASSPALNAQVAPFISNVSTPLRNHTFTTRIDHQFTGTHSGTFLLQVGRLTNLRQFGGGNRLSDALQSHTRNSNAISYSDSLVLSSNSVNQLRAQWSGLKPSFKVQSQNRPVVLIAINDSLPAGDPSQRSVTLIAGSSSAGATDRSEERFQAQDILAYASDPHSFKFGFDAQRIRSTFIDLADASGTYNFASAGDFLAGIPSRFRQSFLTESTQRNSYLGFFIQDEWRVFARGLLSYGLRYERETVLRDGDNFGPRLSLAYDPFGSGKSVLRLGGGIFYNRVLLRTVDDFTLGKQKLFFDTNALTDLLTGRLLTSDERRAFIAAHLQFPNILAPESVLVSQFAARNSNFSRRLDPKLRIPESYQANVGFEQDLGRDFVLEANFTFNRGIHLWREFNANAPILPSGYKNFSEYLASRDFANFRSTVSSLRPLYNAASAGELVRFTFAPADPRNPNAISRLNEFGVPVSLINLNSINSSTAVEVALAALNDLRPDPKLAEVEQLISVGSSSYRGLTLELRKRFTAVEGGVSFMFRAAYTVSRLTDDGVVNTSDALIAGDFRAERARSLLDRRHRFVFSGTFNLPEFLGKLRLSPVWRIASGAPFNISLGGADRNLDDVSNDRPLFNGDREQLHWRAPGQPLDPAVLTSFGLPTIGETGNLPRNAGQGPGLFFLDLNVTREFRVAEHIRVRPSLEVDNVLNKTVFSFGSEFINFSALSPTATPQQQQAFLDSFLVATRTLRQRQVRLGIRVDF